MAEDSSRSKGGIMDDDKTLLDKFGPVEVKETDEQESKKEFMKMMASVMQRRHDPPKKNMPCCKCHKPTRSHFDSKTGTVTCHECWLKQPPVNVTLSSPS